MQVQTTSTPNAAAGQHERLLRLPAVIERTGLGKSAIYAKSRTGEFPSAIKLSSRTVCWSESSISAWIAERIKAAGQA